MMDVDAAVRTIAATRRDEVVVTTMSGLGFWDEPQGLDFRLLGLMGAAASIGLGIAIGRPDRDVWVIDGDGSLLMQLGALAAVADAAPPRFVHVVLVNGVYAISGSQPVPARGRLSWERLAIAAGYRGVDGCATEEDLSEALRRHAPGPRLVAAHCTGERPAYPRGAFDFDATGEADRVRQALARNGGRAMLAPAMDGRRP